MMEGGNDKLMIGTFIGSDQEPVRDEGAERALVEPVGPNTGNFQNSWARFTLVN